MVPSARVSLALAPVLFALTAHAGESGPDLRRFAAQSRAVSLCEDLLAKGEHARALASVLRIEKDLLPAFRPRTDRIAAACYLEAGVPDRALDRLKEYVEDKSEFHPEWWECCDLAGRAYIVRGEHYLALRLYDRCAQNASGRARVLAAEGCGKALEGLKSYAKAVQAYEFGLKDLRTSLPDYDRDMELESRLRTARDRAARLRDVELYGEDFVLYRDAEHCRRVRRQWRNARTVYLGLVEKHPESPYADAARLYSAMCLAEIGEDREGERELAEFYRRDRWGLWRGEALVELARLRLEFHADLGGASRYLDELVKWLDEVPVQEEYVKSFAIGEAAREVTRPPATETRTDSWGNVKNSEVKPGQVVNRRTCAWYLDEVAERCWSFRGFVRFASGDMKGARECFERMREFTDAESKRIYLSDFWRLRRATEVGYMYGTPEELATLKGTARTEAQLGDFYYLTQDFERAGRTYRSVLDGRFGSLAARARQYPHYAYATSLYWTKGREAAFAEYMKLLERRYGTAIEDRAAYCAGNIAREVADEAVRTRGRELLRELAFSGRRNEHVWKAWIVYARDLVADGRPEEGLKLLAALPRAAGDYHDLAQYYLSEDRKGGD